MKCVSFGQYFWNTMYGDRICMQIFQLAASVEVRPTNFWGHILKPDFFDKISKSMSFDFDVCSSITAIRKDTLFFFFCLVFFTNVHWLYLVIAILYYNNYMY